jgi:hypothetical protein
MKARVVVAVLCMAMAHDRVSANGAATPAPAYKDLSNRLKSWIFQNPGAAAIKGAAQDLKECSYGDSAAACTQLNELAQDLTSGEHKANAAIAVANYAKSVVRDVARDLARDLAADVSPSEPIDLSVIVSDDPSELNTLIRTLESRFLFKPALSDFKKSIRALLEMVECIQECNIQLQQAKTTPLGSTDSNARKTYADAVRTQVVRVAGQINSSLQVIDNLVSPNKHPVKPTTQAIKNAIGLIQNSCSTQKKIDSDLETLINSTRTAEEARRASSKREKLPQDQVESLRNLQREAGEVIECIKNTEGLCSNDTTGALCYLAVQEAPSILEMMRRAAYIGGAIYAAPYVLSCAPSLLGAITPLFSSSWTATVFGLYMCVEALNFGASNWTDVGSKIELPRIRLLPNDFTLDARLPLLALCQVASSLWGGYISSISTQWTSGRKMHAVTLCARGAIAAGVSFVMLYPALVWLYQCLPAVTDSASAIVQLAKTQNPMLIGGVVAVVALAVTIWRSERVQAFLSWGTLCTIGGVVIYNSSCFSMYACTVWGLLGTLCLGDLSGGERTSVLRSLSQECEYSSILNSGHMVYMQRVTKYLAIPALGITALAINPLLNSSVYTRVVDGLIFAGITLTAACSCSKTLHNQVSTVGEQLKAKTMAFGSASWGFATKCAKSVGVDIIWHYIATAGGIVASPFKSMYNWCTNKSQQAPQGAQQHLPDGWGCPTSFIGWLNAFTEGNKLNFYLVASEATWGMISGEAIASSASLTHYAPFVLASIISIVSQQNLSARAWIAKQPTWLQAWYAVPQALLPAITAGVAGFHGVNIIPLALSVFMLWKWAPGHWSRKPERAFEFEGWTDILPKPQAELNTLTQRLLFPAMPALYVIADVCARYGHTGMIQALPVLSTLVFVARLATPYLTTANTVDQNAHPQVSSTNDTPIETQPKTTKPPSFVPFSADMRSSTAGCAWSCGVVGAVLSAIFIGAQFALALDINLMIPGGCIAGCALLSAAGWVNIDDKPKKAVA